MHFDFDEDDLFLILSGDQLYRMDFRDIVERHLSTGAEVTVAGTPVERGECSAFGLMRLDDKGFITEFVEKPKDQKVIDELILRPGMAGAEGLAKGEYCLANMGIYVFSARTLQRALDNDMDDFGKEVIPSLLGTSRLAAHVYNGYWEDIGTIKAFFEANLRLTDDIPPFNFFDSDRPIFTRARYLAASKVNASRMEKVIMGGGCVVSDAELRRCVVGIRAAIRPGTVIENSVVMGADLFENFRDFEHNKAVGQPNIGVGRNCRIEHAILDKNVRIGDNVKLSPRGKPDMWEQNGLVVRDGVLIVTKNCTVPSGTVIWPEDEGEQQSVKKL
jgi:glucose-1-phosphate adenylyltransferase